MTAHMLRAAFVLLACLLGAVPAAGAEAKNAWVTIFYEAGRNDDEYHLGARVLMQSIKTSGTEADRVILVGEGTQQRYVDGFKQDGLITKTITNVPSPFEKTLKRFSFSLNKLKIWQMTEYERVIFLDADVIVVQPADFLFKCGHFCAVYLNPVNFHTALLVVKPDQEKYQDLIDSLPRLGSFDGADQGYFNAYFGKKLSKAQEWTKELPPSDDEVNRLPVSYNMHHIYYYEKMSWGGPWGGEANIVTMTYPILPMGKPWFWWGYPLMDMHFKWLRYRNEIDSVFNYPLQLFTLVMAPLLHVMLTQMLKRYGARSEVSHDVESQERAGVWFSWGRNSCVVVFVGAGVMVASAAVAQLMAPGITPPLLGWTLFLSYYGLGVYHTSSFLWKRHFGAKLRVESQHFALFAAPWALYFVAACYPSYPHGIIKLLTVCFALLLSAACNVALFKLVYDTNRR